MWDGEIYGTLGPNCCDADTIEAMIHAGMTGMRLNLSHTSLLESRAWIDALHEAGARTGKQPELLIDMQGPEIRIGHFKGEMNLAEGSSVTITATAGSGLRNSDAFENDSRAVLPSGKNSSDISVPGFISVDEDIFLHLRKGQHLLLDDGKIELEVERLNNIVKGIRIPGSADINKSTENNWIPENADSNKSAKSNRLPENTDINKSTEGNRIPKNTDINKSTEGNMMSENADAQNKRSTASALCRVIRGGTLTGGKSLKIIGEDISRPALTDADLENIRIAGSFGVSALMQPFVHSGSELREVRSALRSAGNEPIHPAESKSLRIFAKIETRGGIRNLDSIIPESDMIVIARGDLGNDMPLWELPAAQKEIERRCLAAGKPFLVVTQMLTSMITSPVPTRAEVSDIFNAVLDGASALMVTNETAVGAHPVEVIRYLKNTADSAAEYMAQNGPWYPLRMSIGKMPDDFMEDREQPIWNEVTKRENF